MAKRKIDMKRYLPLGVPMDKVLSYFGLGLIAASLISLQFVARYSKALDALYYWQNKKRVAVRLECDRTVSVPFQHQCP